jgi:two-component system, chemotaxis family, response regulator Rcp1
MANDGAATRAIEVLLAEDREDDALLTREAFRRTGRRINLHHVENGLACMAFLRNEDPYVEAPTPDLLLLDLNMPLMSGQEVLAAIVADERLRHLPVVVLTTSDADLDVLAMYQMRCSSYITKPVDFDRFLNVISVLAEYWTSLVVLPPR